MHPKNQIKTDHGAFFDWLGDFGPSKSRNGGKAFMKRGCRRVVRRDGKHQIKQELDNII
jgi:hypothetical protein